MRILLLFLAFLAVLGPFTSCVNIAQRTHLEHGAGHLHFGVDDGFLLIVFTSLAVSTAL